MTMLNDFNLLNEDQKKECCEALMQSLQMTIQVYAHSNEVDNLPISAVLDSLMMLAAAGLENSTQEEKQQYVSDAVVLLRKITNTETS